MLNIVSHQYTVKNKARIRTWIPTCRTMLLMKIQRGCHRQAI